MLVLILALSTLGSLIVGGLVIRLSHSKFSWMLDHDTKSVQKFHDQSVSRLGSVPLISGFLCTLLVITPDAREMLLWLMMASVPVLAGGFAEDLTKKVSPLVRLVLSFVSAAIGFFLLADAQVIYLGVPVIDDYLLTVAPVSLIITVIMLSGVSHAVNIIDGYNGLMPGFMVMLFAVMTYVSYQLHDVLMLQINLALCGAVLGFIYWNFPYGKIFSGDGGAYFLGYVAAALILLLVNRNPVLSPWFAFVDKNIVKSF